MAKPSPILRLVTVTVVGGLVGVWLAAGLGHEGPRVEPERWPDVAQIDVRGTGGSVKASARSAREDRAGAAVELDAPVPRSARERTRPVANPDDERYALRHDAVAWAASVEDEDGRTLSGARVAAFAISAGVPVSPPLAQAEVGRDGIAYLGVAGTSEVYVVACAPGRVPLARTLRPTPGERAQLEPFVLGRGASIAGRVSVGGEALERAQVDATPLASCLTLRLDGATIGWRQGAFVPAGSSTQTAADGSYVVSGLEPGEHRLTITTVRTRDAALDVTRIEPRRASAPASDVDFELPGARLELAFESESRPLCCVDVQIQAGDRQFMRRTDDRGRIAIRIQPATEYPIVAARSGYETRRVHLGGLAAGGRAASTIELAPQRQLATVEFDDGGPRDLRIRESASFTFHARFAALDMPDFERTALRDPVSGRFRVEDVPSGTWRVTARVGSAWPVDPSMRTAQGEPIRNTCDTEVNVDVPDATSRASASRPSVVVALTPLVRGWLVVTARSPSGTELAPQIEVFDLAGERVDVARADGRLGGYEPRLGQALDLAPGPAEVRTRACAGPLDVVVSAPGHDAVRRRVVLVMGQPTGLDVTLPPR